VRSGTSDVVPTVLALDKNHSKYIGAAVIPALTGEAGTLVVSRGKTSSIRSANNENSRVFSPLPRFAFEWNENCSANSIGAA
jgi:hypothetical protein